MAQNPEIVNLVEMVDALPAAERALFQRIYAVSASTGELAIPNVLVPWVKQHFGSMENIARQKIVRLTNRVTDEEVFFNELRAARPVDVKGVGSLETELTRASENDVFRAPLTNTPEDSFGRVTGKHCITAGNIAKNDAVHGVIIFNNSNPLLFTRDEVVDYIDTGLEWARRAQQARPEAKYFLFYWNCLWRAGASLVHGHAQVQLTSGRHYIKVERLRRAAEQYRLRYGADYFSDLFEVHRALGCAFVRDGVRIMTSLTPFKFAEVVLMADELDLSFKEQAYDVLACLRDRFGVSSFNFGLVTPPESPTEESWQGFPVLARVIDRGGLLDRMSDVGSVEVFGATVVYVDPLKIARRLAEYLT